MVHVFQMTFIDIQKKPDGLFEKDQVVFLEKTKGLHRED